MSNSCGNILHRVVEAATPAEGPAPIDDTMQMPSIFTADGLTPGNPEDEASVKAGPPLGNGKRKRVRKKV